MSKEKFEYFTDDVFLKDRAPSDASVARKEAREALRSKKAKKEKASKIKDPKLQAKAKKRRKVFIICLLIVIAVVALLSKTVLKLGSLILQKNEAQKELDALKEKEASLTEELKQVNSDEYVEQQARIQLHMVLPGELQYIVETQDTPTDGAIENED